MVISMIAYYFRYQFMYTYVCIEIHTHSHSLSHLLLSHPHPSLFTFFYLVAVSLATYLPWNGAEYVPPRQHKILQSTIQVRTHVLTPGFLEESFSMYNMRIVRANVDTCSCTCVGILSCVSTSVRMLLRAVVHCPC